VIAAVTDIKQAIAEEFYPCGSATCITPELNVAASRAV